MPRWSSQLQCCQHPVDTLPPAPVDINVAGHLEPRHLPSAERTVGIKCWYLDLSPFCRVNHRFNPLPLAVVYAKKAQHVQVCACPAGFLMQRLLHFSEASSAGLGWNCAALRLVQQFSDIPHPPIPCQLVQAAVACGRTWHVPVSPASGRHSYQGMSVQSGGLTVDLSNMTQVLTGEGGQEGEVWRLLYWLHCHHLLCLCCPALQWHCSGICSAHPPVHEPVP